MTAARSRAGIVAVLVLASVASVCACKSASKQRELPTQHELPAQRELPTQPELPWAHDEATAFERARAEGKGVMIHFAATWCTPCEELERTFVDAKVYDAITSKFVPLEVDVTDGTDADEEAKVRYDAMTLPSVVFASADGAVLGRVRELVTPDQLAAVVREATERLARPK